MKPSDEDDCQVVGRKVGRKLTGGRVSQAMTRNLDARST